MERRIAISGVIGGMGTGSTAMMDGKKAKLSAKYCPVAKMGDKLGVLEFRQWLMTIERQLESAFDMKGIDM